MTTKNECPKMVCIPAEDYEALKKAIVRIDNCGSSKKPARKPVAAKRTAKSVKTPAKAVKKPVTAKKPVKKAKTVKANPMTVVDYEETPKKVAKPKAVKTAPKKTVQAKPKAKTVKAKTTKKVAKPKSNPIAVVDYEETPRESRTYQGKVVQRREPTKWALNQIPAGKPRKSKAEKMDEKVQIAKAKQELKQIKAADRQDRKERMAEKRQELVNKLAERKADREQKKREKLERAQAIQKAREVKELPAPKVEVVEESVKGLPAPEVAQIEAPKEIVLEDCSQYGLIGKAACKRRNKKLVSGN